MDGGTSECSWCDVNVIHMYRREADPGQTDKHNDIDRVVFRRPASLDASGCVTAKRTEGP